MQQQILIPLDGSALAEAILPHAVAFALATGSALTLLSVIPLTVVFDPTYGPLVMPEQAQENLAAVTRDYLATVASRLETEGLLVHTEVLEGDPAPSIVSYAEHDPGIRLIAMASHGRSAVARWVFGSVAAKVLQATATPLLLFCPHQHTIPVPGPVSYQTILVPLDGSISAEQVLVHAQALAAAVGATLILVSVVHASEHLATDRAGGIPPWVTAHVQAETERRTRYLEHKAQPLREQGLAVQTEVVCGQPVEGILQSSARHHCNLIVLTSRGRSELQRLLLGSVALKVLQRAEIAVLLVPTPARGAPPPARRGQTDRWPLGQMTSSL